MSEWRISPDDPRWVLNASGQVILECEDKYIAELVVNDHNTAETQANAALALAEGREE